MWLATAAVLTIFCATCKPVPVVVVPENEWGHIEWLGDIVDGVILPDLAGRMQGKTVSVITRAALYDYTLLKRYANKHGLQYK